MAFIYHAVLVNERPSAAQDEDASNLLISAMVITPAALELVLLWPFSLGGDDDRP